MLVDDTSTAWGTGAPDDHLAIQYWRDPLVVSTATTSTAVTVRFQRDVQAPATAITVSGLFGDISGTTTEPTPGTLVWTPAVPLPNGAYQATVAGVSSTGDGGVPIREPYTFTFTLP
jgi:hypothetical protein